MSEWLRPILGAALLLAGAGGLAYKVISGYRHASPDAFFSVHDQTAASPVDHPTQAATVPVDVAAPAQGATSAAQTPASAAQTAASAAQTAESVPRTAPITAAAAAESGNTLAIASRAASNAALPAEVQDKCVLIMAEQREIQGALKKQYSPEQGRFMQRRLRELAEQSVNLKCAE